MEKDYPLHATDQLTLLAKEKGVNSWHELTKLISSLPYGRNTSRTDRKFVLIEDKGTCSSKHALLKELADLNGIPDITLVIGIYRMNHVNTPKIGSTLTEHSLDFIPEAHCYLKVNSRRMDFTTHEAEFEKIESDILQEIEINPDQVGAFKIEYHKAYLQQWLDDIKSDLNLSEIWAIRERCIENLTSWK